MSDKVQKIKEEVERLKNHTLDIQKSEDGLVTSVGRGRVEAFNDVLKFIDSLPEEHNEDLEEEIENYIKDSLAIKFPTTDKEQIKADIRYIAHHFAEWQKQQDEELFSKDTWNYIEENYPNITEEEKLRLYDVSIQKKLHG